MTATLPGTSLDREPRDPSPTAFAVPAKVVWTLIAVCVCAAGLIGYGIGADHGSSPRMLVGRAYVTPSQVGIAANGRQYGFEINPNGLRWYDDQGNAHEGGVPPCLRRSGYTWLRFGYAEAKGPDSESWPVVTWTQCVARP